MEFLPPPLVLLAELAEDDELLPPLATGLEGEADTVRREAGELELRLYEPEAEEVRLYLVWKQNRLD